jgi:hypothetical protein
MARPPHLVYHRTPLPPGAAPWQGWRMLCWMLIVFSPFIGFAVHGKVVEAGLITGLWLALLPLAALLGLSWRDRRAQRRVPASTWAERRSGRRFGPEGAPPITAPRRFENGPRWMQLRADGVLVSRPALLNVRVAGSLAEQMAAHHAADAAGQFFVPWADIDTWTVATDSDGPNFHHLALHSGGEVKLARFTPTHGHEADVLDAVRAIGQCVLWLRDDLPGA